MTALREALASGQRMPAQPIARPGRPHPLQALRAPSAPQPRPAFLAHARLRRASPISHFATAAALEAIGQDAPRIQSGAWRLGIVLAVLSGCVNYSRRFYDETLKDPATASPLVFPETVFNAPASHIAALLGTTTINYTLVGDAGMFVAGLALAGDWLLSGRVDACLVIGAEESDWLTADAFQLFDREVRVSEGAGAIYLKPSPSAPDAIQLAAVTDPFPFVRARTRREAVESVRDQLPPCCPNYLLCDSAVGVSRMDEPEQQAWNCWSGPRLSPKAILGEGLAASSAWQCVAALDALREGRYAAAHVSVVGCNQQAIGAHFISARPPISIAPAT